MSHKEGEERLKRIRAIDSLFSSKPGEFFTPYQIEEHVIKACGIKYNRFQRKRDIEALQSMGGQIKDRIVSSSSPGRPVKAYGYIDRDATIFNDNLSIDDYQLIKNVLSVLQLKGLNNLKPFLKAKETALKKNKKKQHTLISFTSNPLENKISKYLDLIFNHIKERQAVSIVMCDRFDKEKTTSHIVSPWYLREYNRRWYLFGLENNEISHYAIDRIMKLSKKSIDYIEPYISVDEILEHVVGISFKKDDPVYEIIFWVSESSADFILKKPIHKSMEEITLEEVEKKVERKFLEKIPKEKGVFLKMHCIINYELRREMISFREALVVLGPKELRAEITDILSKMISLYE